jgi:ATP-dependent DNA ligase
MQLSRVTAPFDNPETRRFSCALAYITDGTCTLISRKNNQYKSFAALRESLAKLKTTAILDGEIVCLDAEGESHFVPLMSGRRKSPDKVPIQAAFWLCSPDAKRGRTG